MDIQNESIAKTRKYLKHSILRSDKVVVGFQNERKEIMDLLQRTIKFGESNSMLLIGPRSVGKTWLIDDIVRELMESEDFTGNGIMVRLHGLIHTDDRLALKAITTQMSLDNAVDGKVFGSFADNLSFLLACLRSGQKATSKSVIFVLEEFDLFCGHHNQTLLYNLFDVSQSAQTPICVLGITSRLDVIELFEKRVKSRFSHRQLFLFSDQTELDAKLANIEDLLKLPFQEEFITSYVVQWNKNVKQLIKDKKFQSVVKRLLDMGSFESIFKNILLLVLSNLNDCHVKMKPEDFEVQLTAFEKDDVVCTLQDLSTLELCLIIAMKHHTEIYDKQPFNFEMILTRYTRFVNVSSNVQAVQRNIVIKAFEHLQNMELISPVNSAANRLQKEYQMFKLLATSNQIIEAVKKYRGLPAEIPQWASSSIA